MQCGSYRRMVSDIQNIIIFKIFEIFENLTDKQTYPEMGPVSLLARTGRISLPLILSNHSHWAVPKIWYRRQTKKLDQAHLSSLVRFQIDDSHDTVVTRRWCDRINQTPKTQSTTDQTHTRYGTMTRRTYQVPGRSKCVINKVVLTSSGEYHRQKRLRRSLFRCVSQREE